jgi:hypothetical protein
MNYEFNNSNTLTQVSVSVGVATYTGTFSNCGTANALVGAWETIAGFSNAGNNGFFGPVQSCTSTHIVVSNLSAVNETNAATAVTVGFQVAASTSGLVDFPTTLLMEYSPVSEGYTLGNSDNYFCLRSSEAVAWLCTTFGEGIAAAGFIDGTALGQQGCSGFFTTPITGDLRGLPLILQLSGTTPSLTLGNGTITVKLGYSAQ